MAERLEIYKCEVCGNIVEILHGGKGQLYCCGKPMLLLPEKTEDEGREKHIPVIENTETGRVIKVGAIPHPMLENHYIEWLDVVTEHCVKRHFFLPGDEPRIEMKCDCKIIKVREHCNVHGLWAKYGA